MIDFTIEYLVLGLVDLLTRRRTALESTDIGKVYAKVLDGALGKIRALPPELRGLPLKDLLAAADVSHDGFYTALWHLTEAYVVAPATDPAVRAAAVRVREAFVPSRSETRRQYPAQAAAAKARRPLLTTLSADLDALPVAGGTARTWAESYVAVGSGNSGRWVPETLAG